MRCLLGGAPLPSQRIIVIAERRQFECCYPVFIAKWP